MALIKCPECGGKVSDKATQCPHCGCPVEQLKSQCKTCPECGQEVDASVMVCPNCAFPFSRIDEIGKSSNAANTIQNGKLIIEVDNPVIPLLASISVKIGGKKVAECHKGDIIELPIEKDCEVSFKWNMAFTSVSIYAAANEVKHLYIGFDSTNLQIYEEVLGQVGDVVVPNEESVAANIPEPMAEEKEQASGNILSFIYDFISPTAFWSIITVLALVVIIFFSLKPSVSSASLSDLKEVIKNKYGEDSELYRRYNKLRSDYLLFPMNNDVLFKQNKGRFAKEYLPLVERFFSFCDSIGAKNASQEILKEKNYWQDAYQDEIGKYGVCKKCGKHCSIDGSYTIPPQNGFPAQEYKDQYNLCGKCAANAPSYAVQKFMREQMGAGAGRKDQEYYAHPSW